MGVTCGRGRCITPKRAKGRGARARGRGGVWAGGRVGWARGGPRWARTVALIPGGQGAGVPVESRRRLCPWGARNMELRWVTPRFDVSPTDFRAPLSLVLSCVHSLRRHVLPQIGLHRFPPCKFLIAPLFYHPLLPSLLPYHLLSSPVPPTGPSAHQIRVRPHGPGQKRT